MAQDLEKIVELLREIAKANNNNTNNFDNLLVEINKKIEEADKDKNFTKLIKTYLSELTSELKEKYTLTLDKYTVIQDILQTLFEDQSGHGKEIKKLYNSFVNNMELLISDIDDIKTNLDTITTNLNDKYNIELEPATNALKTLKTLNFKFDNSLDSVNTDLNAIINKIIKPGRAKIIQPDENQINNMYDAFKNLLDYINTSTQNEDRLIQVLSNLETNNKLKLTQGILDSIFSKSEEAIEKIKNITNNGKIYQIKEKLSDKNNETARSKSYNNIAETSDDIINNINDVKKALAVITQNIDKNPDTKKLDESLQNIAIKINTLSEYISKNLPENLTDIDTKISEFITELTTVRNIVTDLNEAVSLKITNTIEEVTTNKNNELKEHIENILAQLPKETDIENLLKIYETSLETIKENTDNISNKLENIPSQDAIEEISSKTDEIETMLDNLNFDEEFENLYNKSETIHDWLEKSNIKENTENTLNQIQSKANQKDVELILKATEDIVNKLEEISYKSNEEASKDFSSNIYEIIDELKNEFINSTSMHNSAVIEQLSELENRVSEIVSSDELNNFVEDLKIFIEKINSENIEISDNIDEIKSCQNSLIERLNMLDTSAFENIVNKHSQKLEEKLTNISEYMTNTISSNTEEIKRAIAEIKEVLENKKSNFDEIDKNNNDTVLSIKNYLKDIKDILDTTDTGINPDTQSQLDTIEAALAQYQTDNKDSINQIIEKLDEYKTIFSPEQTNLPNSEIESAKTDIEEIKEQIKQLSEAFSSLDFEKDSKENDISSFIADKLVEISDNLSELTSEMENKLQNGFAYSAELIEEKTATLLDFIQELRHENTQSPELYEKLTIADSKLLDSKQELELINTDVINNLSAKTDQLLVDLAPIKEMIANLNTNTNNSNGETLKDNLTDLHDSVQGDLIECTRYSKSTYEKLEETYNKIKENLSETENHLRDFILGDIDSVIIKVDSLRDYMEESLSKITPPDAEHMEEFRTFVNQINEFKDEQKQLITDTAEDIKTSIGDQMSEQHEEIKSMLTVAINNEEIVNAIDNLKRCFKLKIKELIKLQKEAAQSNQDNILDFGSNQYEQVFEAGKNAQIIEDIKKDFDRFSELIKDLSGDNTQIEEVLGIIKEKMSTLSVAKAAPEIIEGDDPTDSMDDDDLEHEIFNQDQDIPVDVTESNDLDEDIEDNEDDDDILIGVNNFDVMKALDLLKQDVKNLHEDMVRLLPQEQHKTNTNFTSVNAIPTLGNDNLLLSLNNKIELLSKAINKDWLEEIKNYISGGEIHSMLEEINDKINILTLSDNSEWIMEIKQALEQLNSGDIETGGEAGKQTQNMLALINEKIDILATSSDYDLMEDIRDAIERLNSIADTNSGSLLNLINEKIDIIASSDNIDDFEEIKDSIQSIEAKLDEVSSAQDLETIKTAITKLEKNLTNTLPSNTEEMSDIRDILDSIEGKIDSVAASETSNNIEDIKYTLLNVDEKVDNVSKLSESDAKITSILEELNHKIDTISKDELSGSKKNIEDVKDLILAQTDYLESFEKNHKTDAVRKCLKELTIEVNNLNNNDSTKKIQQTIKEMKESIMAAVVTVFDQVSFVEESEDIKDFVEEKTDEINQNLTAVTKQLKQITNADDAPDYTYSMQDIESDLAKLRLALNELQTSEQETQASRLSFILDNINQIGASVIDLQNSLTKEEVFGLKTRFDRINTDIKSLNAIVNQLLIASGESYNALNNGLEDFGKIITDQLASKVDNVTKMLEKSNESDKVMRQALIYMGEWIDSASDSMNKISTNSEEIVDIKSTLEGLKKEIPEQTDILNSIEEKFDEQQERLAYFEKQISKLGGLEDKFEEQQERIDRLEMALEKILSAVEDIDDSKVTRKIDKIDKQIAKLSTNIEKLASYVD